jgi:hypothetical protein
MVGGHALRILAALVATLSLPVVAHAVPVTWEARGVIDVSSLDQLFFETFMPELAGTKVNDPFRLRITFDTDAVPNDPVILPGGGKTRSFEATKLVMTLEVPGRGTHVFEMDDTVPPGTHSLIGIIDDQVVGDLVRDGVQFQHNYLTPDGDGVLQFEFLAAFFSANTTVIDGLFLPFKPHRLLDAGIEHLFSINANPPEIGNLSGIVWSLVHLPEPGTLTLLMLGLLALGATRRSTSLSVRTS